MPDVMPAGNGKPWGSFAKLVYVLGLAVLLFATQLPVALFALLGLQLVLWFGARLSFRQLLRTTYRLRLFFLFIVLSYAFLSTHGQLADDWRSMQLFGFEPAINLAGIKLAGLMCLRVLVLVLASGWMQRSAAPGSLVGAMRMLRLPETLAITVDATLALLAGDDRGGQGGGEGSGQGGGKGEGKGKGEQRRAKKTPVSWQAIRRGELGNIGDMFDNALLRAGDYLRKRYPDLGETALRDLTIVLAVSLAVMGLKVFQVLPGLPIASGHKNIIIVPLLLFAASATHSRFGGLLAGSAVGIVSFLLGYGKYGVLEIAHFAVPGLLADLLVPFMKARSRRWQLAQFALAGLALGLGRFTANLLVIILAGAPLPAFLLFAPMLTSQMAFGALSCFASILIVNTKLPQNSVTAIQGDSKNERNT
ncbi:MAG: energy-coupling factor transporter transmembrane component T [Gammaproteobacteria bacterium]|nr:energy-coupling factor transporter transmembrane component T [Gammaproteobacteria bacterium]